MNGTQRYVLIYNFVYISFDVFREGQRVEYPMCWKIKFKTLVKNEKQDCEFMILNMKDENLNEREC